jgi:uncharacterized membrane protein
MEGLIGYILIGGVLLSVALIAAGLAWRFVVSGNFGVSHVVKGVNLLHFMTAIPQLGSRPSLLVNLGIVVLMFTPYTRVLGSAFYFAMVEHDWKYTAFTIFVLGILTYCLFIR